MYWGSVVTGLWFEFFSKFWLVWINWQVVLVVFGCMVFPCSGAVPYASEGYPQNYNINRLKPHLNDHMFICDYRQQPFGQNQGHTGELDNGNVTGLQGHIKEGDPQGCQQ